MNLKRKFVVLLKRLVLGYRASSEDYINYLRKKGMIIGDNCYVWTPMHVCIDQSRPFAIEIGNNVNITSGVTILTHGYDWSVLKANTGKVYGSYGKVTIGNNVFIGMNATILKGVTIGDNVIIGAGSIITHDIESNSVVVGNPAKKICDLETYKRKIEKNQFEQAFNLYKDLFNRYKKQPDEKYFDEFFFLWSNEFDKLSSKEIHQLSNTGNIDFSKKILKNNNKRFESFDIFSQYCFQLIMENNNEKITKKQ